MKVQDYINKPITSVLSLGQALTNECDMNCAHCYSRPYSKGKVGIADCANVLAAFPNVKEINFGTGETYLNPDFLKIFDFYSKKGIKLALTTNGSTLKRMSDADIVKYLSDVDISLDFPSAELHDAWRIKGAFNNAISGIERCKELGVNTSVALALTNKNYRYLPQFAELLEKYRVILRINIYKPVHDASLALSYEQFWEAVKLMADNFEMIGNSEPILSLLWENGRNGSPCSHSLRIHTDLSISGCVYLSNKVIDTEEFLKISDTVPEVCRQCKVKEKCRGGCMSRRILLSGIGNPDAYCPLVRGRKVPEITFQKSTPKDLVHLNYLCTILLSRKHQ